MSELYVTQLCFHLKYNVQYYISLQFNGAWTVHNVGRVKYSKEPFFWERSGSVVECLTRD